MKFDLILNSLKDIVILYVEKNQLNCLSDDTKQALCTARDQVVIMDRFYYSYTFGPILGINIYG